MNNDRYHSIAKTDNLFYICTMSLAKSSVNLKFYNQSLVAMNNEIESDV